MTQKKKKFYKISKINARIKMDKSKRNPTLHVSEDFVYFRREFAAIFMF